MSGEACPMPIPPTADEETIIRHLLQAHRIAVVGLADDPSRPSHYVSEYMMASGKEIIPVNPNHEQVLGKKCYKSLKDVPGQIDLVNVFRRSEFCADVVRDASAVGAKGVWLQSGILSTEAEQLARDAGIPFIQNRCLMVEHSRRG
jgi:predicted CoA-binding protein